MDSIIHVTGLSQHHQSKSPPTSRTLAHHLDSLSSITTLTSSTASAPSSGLSRFQLPLNSPSTSKLPSSLPASFSPSPANHDMTTLPDPRSRPSNHSSDDGRPANSSPDTHPDDEVTTLSTKLINAINHQTILDDSLSATRHQLESALERIRELESQNEAHRQMMTTDVWVRRSSVEADKREMQSKLSIEVKKRMQMEREKKKIEQELENLTTALFEEANKMVIAAKEEAQAERDALRRRIDQLKGHLADSDGLLRSQQDQLSELKAVMESMASERPDHGYGQSDLAPPSSSPSASSYEAAHADGLVTDSGPRRLPSRSPDDVSLPRNPTTLQHLIQPVLRTDLAAYHDFLSLAHLSHKRSSSSRVSSGSMAGLAALSLGLGASSSSATSSLPSLAPTTAALHTRPASRPSSAPQSPKTPASAASATSATVSSLATPSLKDARFFKRTLVEDIEPTLRLDVAPGLSWLARRSVLAAVTDGSLVVEPVPAASASTLSSMTRPQYYPCSLCGESRTSTDHLRFHRFRTSDADSAQRYPLCNYCLTRVRSTCDFIGFLRILRDGHWRTDDRDHEEAAWEESVRLREQMFWARIGGGVIPVGPSAVTSPAAALESEARRGTAQDGQDEDDDDDDDDDGDEQPAQKLDPTDTTPPAEALLVGLASGTTALGHDPETADVASSTASPLPASSPTTDPQMDTAAP